MKSPDTEAYLQAQGMIAGQDYITVGFRSAETDARNSLLILPPTEAQYAANETLVLQYQYEVQWHQNGIDQSSTVTETVTYCPTLIA